MEALTMDLFSEIDVGYRQIFERSPLPMWVYDLRSLRMLEVNDAALARYGYSRQAFMRLRLTDLHAPEDAVKLQEHLKLPLIERVAQKAWRHRRRDGGEFEVEIVTQDLKFGGARVRLVMVTDMSVQRRLERKRRELEQRMTGVLESMTDAFLLLDRKWCFTYVNPQAEKVLQRSRDELLGRNVWEEYPAAVGSVYQTQYELAVAESRAVSFEAPDADGLNTWLSVTAYPSERGLAVYFRDITETHRADQALQEERQTLAAVISATTDAIVSTDVHGRIRIFNPGAERVFGRSRESMEGKTIDPLLPEEFRAAHAQHLRSFAESATASRVLQFGRRIKGLRADGREIELEVTISKVEHGGELLLIACMRDVTERVRLDAEFQRSREQLSDLTQRLMTQERALVRGLAQTLHDHLGQTMAAIRMAHETTLTLQATQGVALSHEVARLQAQTGVLIGHAITQIRQVLMDLRPPLLEEQGFASALDNELRNRALTQPQIDISFHVAPETGEVRWPSEVEYAAFMVAREAVENALRHSGSPSISVRLSGTAGSLELEVADIGVGLMAESAERKARHLGILGMQERAQMAGAKVTMNSEPGRGTRVSFRWRSPA